ncbi:hypothetical protein KY290_020300 [Solanum tuberosum]|uniref:Uncharacterized protein n=1 Tax=Solanum tuberosum TaxID=4113 RepID=A0ABQ7UYA0_SOLTU|nr:hypothetical protein KY290_020300 [Solanum tuberosum]
MKERGKAAMETDTFSDSNYSVSSDMPCKKHPSSSSIGICSYCLKEKLVNLVCSECGEQRLSSCSCSDSSEVGRIGRISSLLENEKKQSIRGGKTEQVIVLRRSSSSCVEIKRNSNGFWKIKRFFSKKKKKGVENGNDLDENSDIWVSDAMAVSRSRSVCSFRGGGFNDTDEGSDYRFSSAKISDVTGGILMDSSDEPRKSGFRSIFTVKESDFTLMDDSAFIDLKLDLSLDSKSDYPGGAVRLSNVSDSNGRVGLDLSGLKSGSSNGAFGHSGSCRMTRSGGKGNKVWKWIFKQSSSKS